MNHIFQGALLKVEGYNRFWVAIEITKEMCKENSRFVKPGLYAFSTMTNGDNPYDYNSYRDFVEIKGNESVVSSVKTLPGWQIKSLTTSKNG